VREIRDRRWRWWVRLVVVHLLSSRPILETRFDLECWRERRRPSKRKRLSSSERNSVAAIGDHVITELLVLGFTLSLDNFRVSIALGTLPFSFRRAVQVALTFGLWDGLAPLAGVLLGRSLDQATGSIASHVGLAVMGVYGLYLLVRALRTPAPEELDHPWALFGIPLSLSLDNLLAGTSLGLLGFSAVLSATIFAAITAVMSFVGLCIGRATGHFIRIRADLLSGVALVGMAVVLALES
jgi:manganese efflux pump family protein